MIKNSKIAIVIEAINSNPNGDPDQGNLPRTLEDGRGYMTQQSIKHKIRKYVHEVYGNESGNEVWIIGSEGNEKQTQNSKKSGLDREGILNKFWDVRLFGGVIGTGDTKGLDAVTGAVQFSTIAESVLPVEVVEECLVNCIATTDEGGGAGLMGNKSYVKYGQYVAYADVSAAQAEKNGVTERDIEILLEAIENMFEFDKTAARPDMYVNAVAVWEFDGRSQSINPRQAVDVAPSGAISFGSLRGVDPRVTTL